MHMLIFECNLHMQTGQHFPIGSVCSAAGQLRVGQSAVRLVWEEVRFLKQSYL